MVVRVRETGHLRLAFSAPSEPSEARACGAVHSVAELPDADHVCWGYDDEADFARAVREFMAEGLRTGQRLMHVDSRPVEHQRELLAPLGDVDELVADGRLELVGLADVYPLDGPGEGPAQLDAYAHATTRALADGHAGLRVTARVGELVNDPDGWSAHVRWESEADRAMSCQPMSVLCGYDNRVVPNGLMLDLNAVHPVAHCGKATAPFRVFWADTSTAVLAGEVDLFYVEALDRILGEAFSQEAVTLDLSELGFIDHHGLRVLAAHSDRSPEGSSGLSMRHAPQAARRLCELLGMRI